MEKYVPEKTPYLKIFVVVAAARIFSYSPHLKKYVVQVVVTSLRFLSIGMGFVGDFIDGIKHN